MEISTNGSARRDEGLVNWSEEIVQTNRNIGVECVDHTYHHGKMKMVTISGMVDLIRVDKYAPLLRKK